MKNLEKMEELKGNLDEAREQGDPRAEASALYGIGAIYFKEKVLEAAADFWSQGEQVCRDSGQDKELARVLLDLARLADLEGNADLAEKRFREALRISEEISWPQGAAKALDGEAGLDLNRGRPEQALELFRKGLELCRGHEDRIGMLFFLDQIAPLLRSLNRADEARETCRELISTAEKIGDRERMALGLASLADLESKAGRLEQAHPYLVLAHDIYVHLGRNEEAELIRTELDRLGFKAKKD